MASSSKMIVEWPFQGNGAKRIYAALVKEDFCHLKGVLKSFTGPKSAVSSKNVIEQTPNNVETSRTIN